VQEGLEVQQAGNSGMGEAVNRRQSAGFEAEAGPSETLPFGAYELHEKIGDGGFAEVFISSRRGAPEGPSLVIKRLHEHLAEDRESVEMFLNEARLMSELDHDNIVQIVALEKIDRRWSIVMERVDGGNLGDFSDLARKIERPIGLEASVHVAHQVALALSHAHDRKDEESGASLDIIHRDIKPDNILISWQGEVKITDFGCAKTSLQEELTRPGVRKGTLDYMSPDQCLGRVVDRRSDIFSLGVVLWELATGKRLYADRSDALVMERIAHEVPRPPSWDNPAVNASLDLIVLRALEKQPDDRFENVDEMARALAWWLDKYAEQDPVAQLTAWLEENWRPRAATATFRAQSGARSHADLVVRAISAPPERPSEAGLVEPGRDEVVTPERFAALQSIIARHTNLPPAAGDFIGREYELECIDEALAATTQLVSLYGPAGIGKSRLAHAFARGRLKAPESRGGGVWICDLSSVTDAESLCAAVASVLVLPDPAADSGEGVDPVDSVARALAARGSTLLVLDNADGLDRESERVLRHWCGQASELEIIQTSHRHLETQDAACIRVPPLSLPVRAATAVESESVQLLVARARAVQPEFSIHPDNAAAICNLVRDLQGNPQAIELAAARLASEDVDFDGSALAGLLNNERVVEARVALDRQTLQSAVAWSWNQLTPEQQTVLAQATVFHGGFTLDGAESVLLNDAGTTPIVELLEELGQRSMLQAYEPGELPGQRRLRVVRLARAYARARLVTKKDAGDALQRHADYYLGLAESIAPLCFRERGLDHVRSISLEQNNLNAILDRALRVQPPTQNSATRALRAALAIEPYAVLRGRYEPWLSWLDDALAAAETVDVDGNLLMRALLARVSALRHLGRQVDAKAALSVADHVADAVNNKLVRARTRLADGNLALSAQNGARARHDFRSALELLDGTDHTIDIAACYVGLGRAARLAARLETAEACLAAAGRLYAEAGHRHGEAVAIATLGAVRMDLDQFERAETDLRSSVAALRALGDRPRQAAAQLDLGALARETGDFAGARRHFEGALEIAAQLGHESLQNAAREQLVRVGG